MRIQVILFENNINLQKKKKYFEAVVTRMLSNQMKKKQSKPYLRHTYLTYIIYHNIIRF